VQDADRESDTDAALVARARLGDARAFEQLVRRHLRVAHAVASRLSPNPVDADDVVQDAFVRALERLDDCRNPARFRAWFLAIVRNRAHNLREREAVRDATPLDDVATLRATDDTTHRVETREFHDMLAKALTELTDLQRNVFVLHDMEGLDHREVAERMDISLSSSRFNLHVARRALRDRLQAELPLEWRQ
jgi:RNA polymerase sigma-70 factor (ECF subfamily)